MPSSSEFCIYVLCDFIKNFTAILFAATLIIIFDIFANSADHVGCWLQIEDEFRAVAGSSKKLRDEWHVVRDAVLQLAEERAMSHQDLSCLLNFTDAYDEGLHTAINVLGNCTHTVCCARLGHPV